MRNAAVSKQDTDTGICFPLHLASPGEKVRITGLSGGKTFREKLQGMGINPGDVVEIVCRQGMGAVVVSAQGTRYGLGGGMALKIMVEKE